MVMFQLFLHSFTCMYVKYIEKWNWYESSCLILLKKNRTIKICLWIGYLFCCFIVNTISSVNCTGMMYSTRLFEWLGGWIICCELWSICHSTHQPTTQLVSWERWGKSKIIEEKEMMMPLIVCISWDKNI